MENRWKRNGGRKRQQKERREEQTERFRDLPLVSKICRVISLLLIILLGITAVVMLGPNILGMEGLIVLTGSMTPNIRAGDMIYIREVSPEELEIGDVITFTLAGSDTRATHRIVELRPEEDAVVTQGDANNVDDGPIPYHRIVGRVVYTIPKLGILVNEAQGPKGILALGGLLIVIVVVTLLPEVLRQSPEEESPDGAADRGQNQQLSTGLLSREGRRNNRNAQKAAPWRAKVVRRTSRKIERRTTASTADSTPPNPPPTSPPRKRPANHTAKPDVDDILAELREKRSKRP